MSKQGPLGEKKQRLSIKRVLAAGSLLERVELDGDNVKLILKEKYNNPDYYNSLSKSLFDLHKTSTPFQVKFELPKRGDSVPYLKLKPNHGYADDKAVYDALISFASPKEVLNAKADLAAGSLLERAELDGDNVKLILKERYNHPDCYVSINLTLYNLYYASTAFQAKFEKPKQGNSVPCLKLKPDHDYAEGQAVQDALVDFASPKEKARNVKETRNVKEILIEGKLLERVELDGDNVRLILKEKYNNPANYFSINQTFYYLHRQSPAFQAKFEKPKQKNRAPCLKLNPDHGYADGQSVQDALIDFASPKEMLNVKEALAEGSLLEGVELDGDNVRLILKEKYNNPENYFSINQTFYHLHRQSPAFKAKFEKPKQKNSAPCLKLNPDHGYADGQSVQDALIDFASPKEMLNVKKALAEGSLLERVELDGDNVRLILKEKYNNPENYFSINQTFYHLHRQSPAFKAKFEKPKQKNRVPCLKLNPDHGYADGQSVLDALIDFASSKEKLNAKAALTAGSLLEDVALDGDKVRLILKQEYNHPDYYISINSALYNLYKVSPAFQDKFEQPKTGNSVPCLKLKPEHGYVERQSVKDALIDFASSKEKLSVNVKTVLAEGNLLKDVALDEDKVKLILKEEYNHPDYYFSINQALYNLHKVSPAFQDKFEQPKMRKSAPCLTLKLNHGYADGQAVQDALIDFAASKEKLNVRETLAAGSLLEGVALDGDSVRLLLKEEYNHPDCYMSINSALYNLYKISPAFQDKFEQPKTGNGVPCLKLKPDHDYAEGQSVKDALISFASPKEKLNVKDALGEGSLLEGVALEGDNVKLLLKEEYTHSDYYRSINRALYDLHRASRVFQDKFEQPKQGKRAPCLKLKSNHGYANGQAVLDVLVGFASPKGKLNVNEALGEGNLLEGVALEGNSVRLILKEKYNHPDYYVLINRALYGRYEISPDFQDKFEKPKQGNRAPGLKLKANHGYVDGQSVKDALVSFAATKEKANPKQALSVGKLLESVALEGETVRLILKEKYNDPDYYVYINKALYSKYKASPAFEAKFEQPKQGNSEPFLKLKPDHGYVDGQSVKDALIDFVARKEKLNIKVALAEGSLLEGVAFEGNSVMLQLKEEYNDSAYFVPINNALYCLYRASPAFQAKFEQPKTGKSAPCLKLKTDHGYIDAQSVHDALLSFASRKEKLIVKAALGAGSLLEGVVLDGDNVRLLLKEKYDNPADYFTITQALYKLHKASPAFQAKFEQPKQAKSEPCLVLKMNHGYVDEQSVKNALVSFAATREKLNFKEILEEGDLLEGAELSEDNVRLILKEKYNNPANYDAINNALYALHKSSLVFQAKFEQPILGNSEPSLKLKPNHGYAEGQSVMDTLISCVSQKEMLTIKEALAEGSLLEGVVLDGDNVKLLLKEEYNDPDFYVSINDGLHTLNKASLAFQAKFEQPTRGEGAPCLKLKPDHGYADSQSVHDALIKFASPKEKLNVKAALAEGSLLEGVEQNGDNVRLILKEKYNNPADYFSISKAFYHLYRASPAFQAKFEQPKQGNRAPCLELKPDHGYVDNQAVLDALIGFAKPQLSNPSRTFLPSFTAALANQTPARFLSSAIEQSEKRQNQLER